MPFLHLALRSADAGRYTLNSDNPLSFDLYIEETIKNQGVSQLEKLELNALVNNQAGRPLDLRPLDLRLDLRPFA